MSDASKFASYQINNIPFYTNRQKGNQILNYLIETCPEDKVVVASVRSYQCKEGKKKVYSKYAQVTDAELHSLLEKDFQIYNVMHEDRVQKVAFDVDSYDDVDPLSQVKENITKKYPDAVMNISGSKTFLAEKNVWKYSYHIVLQNYIVNNVNDLCEVKEWCAMPEQKAIGFDPAVYRVNGLLKCINQSKGDKDHNGQPRIQKYVEGSKVFLDHSILHNIPDDAVILQMPTVSKKRSAVDKPIKTKKQKLVNVSKLSKMDLPVPEGFDLQNSDPHTLLSMMPNYPRKHKFQLSNDDCCDVARWCKTVGMEFEDFWNWCKQKDDSAERQKKYRDFWDRSCYPIAFNHMKSNLLQCYNKDIIKSRAFKRLQGIMNSHIDIPLNDQYLTKGILDEAFKESKTVVLSTPCGSNKTGAVIAYLNQYRKDRPDARILWVTCRIALTEEQRGRLGRGWVFYLDFKDDDAMTKTKCGKKPVYQYLVCSTTSLSKYVDMDTTYDLIVYDESETLLTSFDGDATCHQGRSHTNWKQLYQLTSKAQTIWMDAFLTNITLDTIKAFRNEKPCIVGKPATTKSRKLILLDGLTNMCEDSDDIKRTSDAIWGQIFKALDDGEKIFIATGAQKVRSEADRESVEGVVAVLKNKYGFERGREMLAYHSLTKKEKQRLINVNEVWGKEEVRVVIGNGCLAVGVNFDPPREQQHRPFDRVFGILDQSCMSPRDFLQLVQRIRHPVHKDVVMYIKYGYSDASVRHMDLSLDGLRLVDFHGVGTLAENLLIERRARYSKDIVKALSLFAEQTSFELECDESVLCAAESKLISSCISTEGHAFEWDSIDDVDDDTYEQILNRMKRFDADMDDYLRSMKYHFRKLFVPDVEEETIAYQWNVNKAPTIALHNIGRLRKDSNAWVSEATAVISEILEENNIDLYKDNYEVKVCSVPFAVIKQAFEFRRPPTTLRNDLYAKIFNSYFQEQIYDRKKGQWYIGRPTVDPVDLAVFHKIVVPF